MRVPAALLLLCTLATAGDFEKRYEDFKKGIGRPTFHKRVRAIEWLAATGDPRALEVLTKVYARPPKEPREHTQYIVASIAWDRFAEPGTVDIWEKWRQKQDKPPDAWLWFRALDIVTMHRGADTALKIAEGKDNIFLRAAALHAIGVYHEPLILPIIPTFLDKRNERGLERALLVEACGRALVRQVNEVGTEEFRSAALKLMKQFDLKETPDRTRAVLGRCFARIFDTEQVYLDSSEPWRALLAAEDAKKVKVDDRYAPAKRPTFVGLEATGKHIVYIIDLSDSMLTPLTPREKDILKGPVSGTRKKPENKEDEKKDDHNPLLEEKDLNWQKITNRFEAAREYLIQSLLSLEPDMEFCVIGFGDRADFLNCTKGLVQASKGNVQAAVSELRAIRPGPKADNRPHGTLRGKTNLHGGFRLAFQLKGRALAKKYAYIDSKTFDSGCDTIFLLSDGDPSWDDFDGQDAKDDFDQVGDPEMGGGGDQNASTLHFAGPYRNNRHLLEDLQRMNLFRQVEIHCVGIGEAQQSYLRSLASVGLGRVRMIGKHVGSEQKKAK